MSPPAAPRPSYLAALVAALLVLLLYVVTLAPTTAMWDASEYIAAAHVLGVPHPPGNPLFILLGRVFAVLPLAPGVAMRINLLAALCSAAAAGMWFLIAERVVARRMAARWQRIVVGFVAALVGATAFTVWNQSVVNEKVYTVSLAFFAIVSWLTVRWCDDPDAPGADRLLVLIAFLIGLGYANHPAGFLVAPAVGVAVIARRARTIVRWRLLLVCVTALGLGLTPFAMQPIRAAHFPALNMGEATGCTEGIGVRCTFSATTWERLEANITREQYGKPSLMDRQAPFVAQLGMWWQYFRWQWLRDVYAEQAGLQHGLALLFLALGLAGGVVHWREDRRSFWFFGPLIGTVTILLVWYMNFEYGFSQAPELGSVVPREVRDRDYFYLWSFSAWSVWVALGLGLVWRHAAEALGGGIPGTGRPARGRGPAESPGPQPPNGDPAKRRQWGAARPWLLASPVLAVAFIPLAGNWRDASRAGETVTREWAHDLLNSVEPYGVLITAGDNDTFPLWYAQEVEGIRKDVTVAVTSLLNLDWYVRQLVRRPVHAYDAGRGPALYRDREWPRPSGSALRMTPAQADSLPPYVILPGPMQFRHGELDARIDPRNLPGGALERSDIVILQLLRDNLDGGRPIYFARSAVREAERIGLRPHLLTQGLVNKVVPAPVLAGAAKDTVHLEWEGWVDLTRTKVLWEQVYQAPESLIAQEGWVDRASLSTPATYVSTGLVLAELLQRSGDVQSSARALDTTVRIARSARISDLFGLPVAPESAAAPMIDGPASVVPPMERSP